jgi:hypothetical protein
LLEASLDPALSTWNESNSAEPDPRLWAAKLGKAPYSAVLGKGTSQTPIESVCEDIYLIGGLSGREPEIGTNFTPHTAARPEYPLSALLAAFGPRPLER